MNPPADARTAAVTYRCVCGESIELSPTTGGACASCGRHYAAAVLRAGAAETVTIDLRHGSTPVDDRPVPDDDALIGRKFGHYQIVERLGHGGMGTVYRALDESLQRYVALKVIRTAVAGAADSRHIQRLLQEAIAQARVNHPHVVHIYFVGCEGDAPFFAMELVNGMTLAQRLASGPLPFAEVVTIGEQIADALRHAVAYDIVHGDIKPSNVLFAEGVGVKLSDFGLARRLSQLGDAGGIAGTPNYIAPEVALGSPPDVRSDLYSLGVTLFEMTFGRLPYSVSGSSLIEWFRAHREAPVEFPEPWPATVPSGWYFVLAKLLQKMPSDRYQTYDELLADLRRLRPIDAPQANRLPRAMAWIADLFVTSLAQQFFYAPLLVGQLAKFFDTRPILQLAIAVAGVSVPALVAWAQSRWKTSPGKELFQIQIVDQHGMSPTAQTLAARSAVQFLPLWLESFSAIAKTLHLDGLANFVFGIAMLALAVDAGFALFHPAGQSLHDRIFRTRVVLNTGQSRTV